MGRIDDARGEDLRLQSPPPVPPQARAQDLAPYPVAFFPQFGLQAPGTVAAFVWSNTASISFSQAGSVVPTAPAAEACRHA